MADSEIIFDFTGQVDHLRINLLVRKLKKSEPFIRLNKTTGKRVYSIVVECLENISKHSAGGKSITEEIVPSLSVRKEKESIMIRSMNPVKKEDIKSLTARINQVNMLEGDDLTRLYEETINMEAKAGAKGAGLGFMIMKMRSGNNLDFHFDDINKNIAVFNLEITVNKYLMRKLIIEETSSSPRVILDPDNKIFEISGESRPPDVGEFYGEILNWMDDYSQNMHKSSGSSDPVVFSFDLEYFNSSSAKYLLDFCKQIANVRSKGLDVTVKWHYEDDDADMLEVGKEMSRMVRFPFEYIEKK